MPIWTPELVADRLVAAYRRVTGGSAIRSIPGGGRLSTHPGRAVDEDLSPAQADELVAAFRWPERFVPDVRDRRYLRTWASCRASGEPVRERCRDLEWPRSTAERRCLAALATIARNRNAGADPSQA